MKTIKGHDHVEVVNIKQPRWATFLFDSPKSAGIWLLLRLWVGLAWLEAAEHKVTDPAWMSTGTAIRGFWERATVVPASGKPVVVYDWYRGFLQMLMDSHAEVWMGKIIAVGELLIALGLITGALVGFAAFFGAFMNLNFMLAGTVSTNPVLFLCAMLLVLAWKVAGYYGLDRYILPALGTPWSMGWLTGHEKTPKAPTTRAASPA